MNVVQTHERTTAERQIIATNRKLAMRWCKSIFFFKFKTFNWTCQLLLLEVQFVTITEQQKYTQTYADYAVVSRHWKPHEFNRTHSSDFAIRFNKEHPIPEAVHDMRPKPFYTEKFLLHLQASSLTFHRSSHCWKLYSYLPVIDKSKNASAVASECRVNF